jgi:ribosomal protein S8
MINTILAEEQINTDLNSVDNALRAINENGMYASSRICYPVFNMMIRKGYIRIKGNNQERKGYACDVELTGAGIAELRRINGYRNSRIEAN